MRLLCFTADSFFSGIFDSQVLTPLRLLGEQVPPIERALLTLTSVRELGSRHLKLREEHVRRALPGVAVHFQYRLMDILPFAQRLWPGQLRRCLHRWAPREDGPIIVHCRGETTAAAAAQVKRHDARLRILLDLRGASEGESDYAGWLRSYLVRRNRRTLQRALAGADAINAVSQRLLQYLSDKGLLRPQLPTCVVPCCVNTQAFYFSAELRRTRRQELGLEDKFVVCYCGAMGRWQRPDAIAAAFAAIRSAMPTAHMLVLTKEAEVFRPHLASAGVAAADVTLRAVGHKEVASFLMAADAALLLREDNLTNQVACPVKFSEYVRCGVPVILTRNIGDLSALVEREQLGAAISFPVVRDEIVQAATRIRQRLEADGDSYRERCSALAAEQLSWEGQLPRLASLYRTLAALR